MEKINGIIYKITNPDGKIYIGQTIRPVEKRFNEYKLLKCKKQPLIYESLLKYGIKNHTFEIIEKEVDNIKDLNFLECFWIKYFDTFNTTWGLNLLSGGKNSKHSEKTKTKLSKLNKGKNHPRFGKTCSQETKRKMSEAQLGEKNHNYGKKGELNPLFGKTGKLNNKSKTCYVLDINKKIIYEFESVGLTSNNFNYDYSGLTKICLGKKKTFLKKQYTAVYNLQDFFDRGFLTEEELKTIQIIKKSPK